MSHCEHSAFTSPPPPRWKPEEIKIHETDKSTADLFCHTYMKTVSVQ